MTTSIAHFPACRAEERWLHAIYPLPDPAVSLEEYHRLTHRDLARRDIAQLERERYRARHRALPDDSSMPWLAERLTAIDAELRRRGIQRWR